MSSSETNPVAPRLASSEVRLSPRQWVVALAIVAAAFLLLPRLWQRLEPIKAGDHARVPYSLGNDYWIYGRYSRLASPKADCLVIGDSVIWGHYVPSHETLSAHLSRQSSDLHFANLGVDGIHPAAMAGLLEYYGGDIARQRVLLHCNLLWMSSRRHDLQVQKDFSFNHPALVPQFWPRIPCYSEPLSGRLGIVIGRHVPMFAWGRHLQMAYFGNSDLPSWTLERPYGNPLSAVTLDLPSPDEPPSPPPVAEPWTKMHFEKFNAAWVELDTSLQWRSFARAIKVLQRRGNQVFVVVGPFNEHMLTDKSQEVYRQRLRHVGAWLAEHEVSHLVAETLPSDDYADASHPLSGGYARLAQQLWKDKAFTSWMRSAVE